MANLNTQQLVDLFNQNALEGKEPLEVTFAETVYEDNYLNKGMKARLIEVHVDDVIAVELDGVPGHETIYEFCFEFGGFSDYNKSLETANYYDSNGTPCLTASEAGWYPKNHRESVYSDNNIPTKYFIVDHEEDYVHALDKDTRDMIIHSLRMERSVFVMRAEEAGKGNLASPPDVEEAKKQLKIVDRALKQLRHSE